MDLHDHRHLRGDHKTQSGIEVKETYTPQDIAHLSFDQDISLPGAYPYTRGSYPRMYREKLWVTGNPFLAGPLPYLSEMGIDPGDYLKELLGTAVPSSGIRTSGDYFNLATVDPDHPLVKYDIGNCTGPLYSIWQMLHGDRKWHAQLLLQSLDEGLVIELGHQAGPPDVCEYSMYLAVLEALGRDPAKLRGNMVNDPLASQITRCMNYKQPLEVSLRVSCDGQEYAYRNTPLFRPTNAGCGYDMREAGINTFQELAFRFATFIEYSDEMIRRGLRFEDFGSRPAMAFSGEIDFFETICKLRAARRMWARIGHQRYGADTSKMRCPPVNTNCAGDSMTQRQQLFNVIRQTIEAMASVLGGVNGMEMKGYTEGVSPPPIEAWVVNRGIERIVAEEANLCLTADPLAGSYYVEWLTDRIEKGSMELLQQILDQGGVIASVRSGWIQAEVERAAQERSLEFEEGRKIRVGDNAYLELNDYPITLPQFPFTRGKPGAPYTEAQRGHHQTWESFKQSRDLAQVEPALQELYRMTKQGHNVIPGMVRAWKAFATIGEVMGVIREGMGFAYDQFEMVPRPAWLHY